VDHGLPFKLPLNVVIAVWEQSGIVSERQHAIAVTAT
jgi:hypothetical protein